MTLALPHIDSPMPRKSTPVARCAVCGRELGSIRALRGKWWICLRHAVAEGKS